MWIPLLGICCLEFTRTVLDSSSVTVKTHLFHLDHNDRQWHDLTSSSATASEVTTLGDIQMCIIIIIICPVHWLLHQVVKSCLIVCGDVATMVVSSAYFRFVILCPPIITLSSFISLFSKSHNVACVHIKFKERERDYTNCLVPFPLRNQPVS